MRLISCAAVLASVVVAVRRKQGQRCCFFGRCFKRPSSESANETPEGALSSSQTMPVDSAPATVAVVKQPESTPLVEYAKSITLSESIADTIECQVVTLHKAVLPQDSATERAIDVAGDKQYTTMDALRSAVAVLEYAAADAATNSRLKVEFYNATRRSLEYASHAIQATMFSETVNMHVAAALRKHIDSLNSALQQSQAQLADVCSSGIDCSMQMQHNAGVAIPTIQLVRYTDMRTSLQFLVDSFEAEATCHVPNRQEALASLHELSATVFSALGQLPIYTYSSPDGASHFHAVKEAAWSVDVARVNARKGFLEDDKTIQQAAYVARAYATWLSSPEFGEWLVNVHGASGAESAMAIVADALSSARKRHESVRQNADNASRLAKDITNLANDLTGTGAILSSPKSDDLANYVVDVSSGDREAYASWITLIVPVLQMLAQSASNVAQAYESIAEMHSVTISVLEARA